MLWEKGPLIEQGLNNLQPTPRNHQSSTIEAPELPDTSTSTPAGVGRRDRGTMHDIFVFVLSSVESFLVFLLNVANASRLMA